MPHEERVPEPFPRIDALRLSRRGLFGRAIALGLAAPGVVTLLAACGDDDDDDAAGETPAAAAATATTTGAAQPTTAGGQATSAPAGETAGEGQRGGTLRIALIGEPPTLDIHQTTATIVSLTTWHMYETLFTWDAEFGITNLLADVHEISEDGLTHTITLREGVPFHNGEPLTSADVVASINRWGQISGLGKSLLAATASLEETDDRTVTFTMSGPFSTLPVLLARQNQGCAIYPKSLIDSVGVEQIEEGFTGTGPYKFVERQPDRFIRMERFEEYAALPGEPQGYGGHKYQYIDELEFIPVPDEAARIAGLQAGDYDYLESIIPDQYDALKDDSSVVVETLPPTGWDVFVLNTKLGLMTDLRIRQAVQAAINVEPVLQAGNGEGFYRIDPGIMLQETAWHSTVSEELYNRNDPEAAKTLLEEAGYDGTPVRFMTTQEYQEQYNEAVIGKQQLEAAGFTVELMVVDWATLVDRRSDETAWDIFTTGFAFRVDPVQLPPMQGCDWPGWWCTPEKVEVVAQLQSESDYDKRFALLEQLQTLLYEQVPVVKLGDTMGVTAMAPKLQDFPDLVQLAPELVNAWIED
jgi:peptide/nickel transport system substrate-binding protein